MVQLCIIMQQKIDNLQRPDASTEFTQEFPANAKHSAGIGHEQVEKPAKSLNYNASQLVVHKYVKRNQIQNQDSVAT